MAAIHVRITEEERAELSEKAQRAGMTVSEYVRCELFGEKLPMGDFLPIPTALKKSWTHTVKTKITEAQAKALTDRCAEAGVTVSEYIRRALAQEPVIVILEGKEILRQLSKLGNNINQLTMLAHQGRITAVDLDEVQRTQKKILQELIKIQKRR